MTLWPWMCFFFNGFTKFSRHMWMLCHFIAANFLIMERLVKYFSFIFCQLTNNLINNLCFGSNIVLSHNSDINIYFCSQCISIGLICENIVFSPLFLHSTWKLELWCTVTLYCNISVFVLCSLHITHKLLLCSQMQNTKSNFQVRPGLQLINICMLGVNNPKSNTVYSKADLIQSWTVSVRFESLTSCWHSLRSVSPSLSSTDSVQRADLLLYQHRGSMHPLPCWGLPEAGL